MPTAVAPKKIKEVPKPAPASRMSELFPWHSRDFDLDGTFHSLQQTMNKLLDSFRHEIGVRPANGDTGAVASRMDVSETDDAFEVVVELPGMDEKNIDLSVTPAALTIRGEKKTETSGKKKDYHFRECSYGSVHRVLPMPANVDVDKVSASFRNGVLKVSLPKVAAAAPEARKVEVKG